MADEFVPLGHVVRLDVLADPSAGERDDMLRDKLTSTVIRYFKLLPATTDLGTLRDAAQSALAKQQQEIGAAQDEQRSIPAGTAADLDFAIMAVAMLMRAAAPEGFPLWGYRWRIVRRDRVDSWAFAAESREADRQMARWLVS